MEFLVVQMLLHVTLMLLQLQMMDHVLMLQQDMTVQVLVYQVLK
jgi:hypothetical protein